GAGGGRWLQASLPPPLAGLARRVLLEGPDDTDAVVGVKARGGGWVSRDEPLVKGAGALVPSLRLQPAPELEVGGGCRIQPLEQRAHVEAGAADQGGKAPPPAEGRDRPQGIPAGGRGGQTPRRASQGHAGGAVR